MLTAHKSCFCGHQAYTILNTGRYSTTGIRLTLQFQSLSLMLHRPAACSMCGCGALI